ncbi:hypothetical protein FNF31_02518 [Cafeteria roenbergensis]|uniref:Terpene cyclase/mutase family member n=1 Tax=Cafeteria roenbergensis TaxID=33653 RepID=A0A5A8DI44_CAFRO|nr:hypothetical protein FNF31_02518 [Cafeteria roenbergensis]
MEWATDPVVLLSIVAGAALLLVLQWQTARPAAGFGSGSNTWFRHIDSTPRKHQPKHHKLEHVWEYTGRGVRPNASGDGFVDDMTGEEVVGPLAGRQTWRPHARDDDDTLRAFEPKDKAFNPVKNPHAADKLLRYQMRTQKGLPAPGTTPSRGAAAAARATVADALRDGIDHLVSLQTPDGHWAGDYGGPFFLLPGFVIMAYVTGVDLGAPTRSALLTYLRNHQQADGSWGLHLEGPGTMLGTALNYAAARLLGMAKDEPAAALSRSWLKAQGGAVSIPAWGKVWLSVLGAYDWEGVNPVPPELWLLPTWLPFHPANFWCHARMVALPMTALYGARFIGPLSPLVTSLRSELYPGTDYASIRWADHRLNICPLDLYSPHTPLFKLVSWVLGAYERVAVPFLRRAGMAAAQAYLDAEDLQSNYVCIGPVNKAFNMVCCFAFHGPDSALFRKHVARVRDYLYVCEDGMRVQGYGGSQLWDTSFAVQAVCEAGMGASVAPQLRRAHAFIDASQVRDDVPLTKEFHRDTARGGWTFSTADNAWPVADCTCEGMRASLALEAGGFAGEDGELAANRYFAAVNLVLAYQNADGGWPTYERERGSSWLESLNPAEVFGDIMIDYSYIELTSACIQGLAEFQGRFPGHRAAQISKAIDRGMAFIRRQQRPDGSWYGSWAVCFTYGAWFAVEAIRTAGNADDAALLDRTCAFLLSKQRDDGGWGETYLSCLKKEYCDAPSSNVQTAWALLALIGAQCPDRDAVARGVRFLLASQTKDGDFPQQQTVGIFNRSCGISYSNYRNIFPVWALGAYARRYDFQDATLVGTL